MSHQEPAHGGQLAGVALLIRIVCSPGFAPPFIEVGFLKSPMSTALFNFTLWTIFLIHYFEVTFSKHLM